jgi:predicted enzyme related to lactoylglutathione lyase
MSKRHTSGHIDFVEFPASDVASLKKTKTFLRSAFGWSFEDWGDDYADIAGGGLGAGLNADPEHRPAAPLVVIYADDLDDVRKRVISAGGEIVRDIFSFPGGRRFHFKEPSGNVLAVWSEG